MQGKAQLITRHAKASMDGNEGRKTLRYAALRPVPWRRLANVRDVEGDRDIGDETWRRLNLGVADCVGGWDGRLRRGSRSIAM